MNIAIVGVGLIGGSISLSLKENQSVKKVFGVDQREENLTKALELGIIDEALNLDQALEKADLIILSVPVDAILEILPNLLNRVTKQVIMDMGSTKKQIIDAVKNHTNRGRLVAAHPMAGTEYSGPSAAFSGLFRDKVMVYVDKEDTDQDAFETAHKITESLEMKSSFMSAKEHDIHTAYISHISHITSMSLALTVLKKEKSQARIFELASSGFASTVRLAKSSPHMWAPIFRQNRENILVVLKEQIDQLQQWYEVLETEDYETLYQLIENANKIKKIIK